MDLVKTKAIGNSAGWQALYRALLRSSAASVRFCRPAARNTRRYLRDEFASAIPAVSTSSIGSGPKTRRSGPKQGAVSDVAGGDPVVPTQLNKSSWPQQLLARQTHNTLAFHLAASLLPSSSHDARRGFADALADQTPSQHANSSASAPNKTEDPPSHWHARQNLGSSALDAGRGALVEQHDGNVGSSRNHPIHWQTQPTRTSRLAHRVIANLGSLTYHHLSPHTQMQSRAHLKLNRALRKPKKLSTVARVLGRSGLATPLTHQVPNEASSHAAGNGSELEHVFGEQESEVVVNEAHMKLGFLMPSVKPVRGPISARLKEWDGQDADKLGSEGGLRQMQADLDTIERLLEDHDGVDVGKGAMQRQPGQMAKQLQQLRDEAVQLKKKIKSASKALAKADAQRQVDQIPIEHLADLVAAAQDAEGILLGKQRWTRRRKNEFLPP